MELVVDVAEALVGYVGVDLGCGDVWVAQEFLDAAEVNALVQQIGGVAVAQSVRGGENRDAWKKGVFFYHSFYWTRRKPGICIIFFIAEVYKQSFLVGVFNIISYF